MHDEQALLAAARQFEAEALAQIHMAYYRPLYRYIAFRVSDPVIAEDLASEVFTRLLRALHDGKAPRRTLRGWLYGVASHVVSDHFRSQHAQAIPLNEALPSREAGPPEAAEAILERESLSEALAELTEEQQQVIALRFGSGLPIREVAAVLGKTTGAVKQLQARAIAALSRALAGDDNQ